MDIKARASAFPGVYLAILAGLPIYVIDVVGRHPSFDTMALFGMVMGALVAAMTGFAFGAIVAVAFGLCAAAGLSTSHHAGWAVALMALVGFLGMVAKRRSDVVPLGVTASLVGTWVFTPMTVLGTAPTAWSNVVAVGLLVGLGGLWGCALGGTLKLKVHVPTAPGQPWRHAIVSGALAAVVFAAGTAVSVHHHFGNGAVWFLLTVAVVNQPFAEHPWIKTGQRVIGTVIGVAIAAGITFLLPPTTSEMAFMLAGLALLAVSVHLTVNPKVAYWKFVVFLTSGLMLLLGAGDARTAIGRSIRHLAFIRLDATLCGVAVSLLMTTLVVIGARLLRRDLIDGSKLPPPGFGTTV